MCRNIKMLFNFDPPVTPEEVRAASLQFVRKISGFNKPSKANEEAFQSAIDAIAGVSTPQVTIGVGKYFIIPSTYKPGTEVGFRMLVYSSIPSIHMQLTGQGGG